MQAKEILNTEIAPLRGQDTVAEALHRMEDLDLDCLPIVDSTTRKLIGQIRTSELRRVEDPDAIVSDLELEEPVKVFKRQHIFEAGRLLLQYELQIISVVDSEITFKGVITMQSILETLPDMLNLVANGSILTIQLEKVDLTLSEIVHLIEVEGAKILGLSVEQPRKEGELFKVSIKINLRDATRITSALRRHDYDVIVDDASRDVFGFDMENRADELMKYIDM
ncbi:CBS domain-containing protein [Aliifodinibius sp. S!AR15-10]|uniref:CBS domain-containing protein n=1 Tax=Aliifodinibius sp. S!AR15-10 TaxID=2950437 RepID=UPI0028653369|nr:CBS domain-containing protein [Aliifodinibius sp. S!AR15-10]MDR8393104.1 CBS domain-containing protein [Aliifodinibius sp. S!AR15-10]